MGGSMEWNREVVPRPPYPLDMEKRKVFALRFFGKNHGFP